MYECRGRQRHLATLARQPPVRDRPKLLVGETDELVQRRQRFRQQVGLRVRFQRDSSLARMNGHPRLERPGA